MCGKRFYWGIIIKTIILNFELLIIPKNSLSFKKSNAKILRIGSPGVLANYKCFKKIKKTNSIKIISFLRCKNYFTSKKIFS